MGIQKIMTKEVATISSMATIKDAAAKMRAQHVGDLIVMDEDDAKKAIGIVTDRDLVLSTVAYGVGAEDVRVADIMSPMLVTARANEGLHKVLHKMKQHGVRRMPVVDGGGHVTGVLSTDDILGLLAAELMDLTQVSSTQRQVEGEKRRAI